MTDDTAKKDTLKITPGKLQLTRTLDAGKVKQNFPHGRSKTVMVEVRTKRAIGSGAEARRTGLGHAQAGEGSHLTDSERAARLKALQSAEAEGPRQPAPRPEQRPVKNEAPAAPAPVDPAEIQARKPVDAAHKARAHVPVDADAEKADKNKGGKLKLARGEERRNSGKITVSQAMGGYDERVRSLASVRRQREKALKKAQSPQSGPAEKFLREVVIPEAITVQELANRMAVRAVDVIKVLMKLGMMVTVTQSIDADTAELVVGEFGHKFKRVSEGDVENVLRDDEAEDPALLMPRPPVVTVMGHVDHGKTSLLDALRKTDVAAKEAGGITQHIGAYQVEIGKGQKVTFLDTPGHEAFTSMRARGAKVTDIVVLVVAADDGIMAQTKEAIAHAKAAGVPIIVAVNKIDKPGADVNRVKTELMNDELVAEEFGGSVIVVPVSAKTGENLDKLVESILVQAEVMELKANPNRPAHGAIVESKLDTGRGVVATLLVQKGSLKTGDIVVAGASSGRVRAIVDDKGRNIALATPGMPVEILGLNEPPEAGDEFSVVADEKTAREIAKYRGDRSRTATQARGVRTVEQMFGAASSGAKELAVIVRGDVQGSVEAIVASIGKFNGEEVSVRVLHSAVGAISESDVTLAKSTGALIIGFNVRASAKAKEMAGRDKVEIRYYSVIYDVVDDVKAALSGLLSPLKKENFIGYAEIRQIFTVSKAGKVAGCMVTEGVVKRGAGVRLLRDGTVIHQGTLKTLKRFKDEVKEVKAGFDCGMAFENYDDIREGDVIEAFEVTEEARTV